MDPISRREFVQRTSVAACALAGGVGESHANPLGYPIGCQTYPVRQMIGQDFPGTIKQLADAGFERIELCSPVGYASSGFGVIAKYKGAELKKVLADLGVHCESCHFSMQELRANLGERIEWAKDAGIVQMIVPSLSGPRTPTMDDVKRIAEEYNKMGEQSTKAGLIQGLHNENFEVSMVGDRRTYDILLELLDPKLVKFQFQASTIRQGFDAAEYFTKYPGRFISMHVQDLSEDKTTYQPVGKGILDWKKIFTAAKTGGIKNYFVEMNLDLMQASVPYLRSLKV